MERYCVPHARGEEMKYLEMPSQIPMCFSYLRDEYDAREARIRLTL
jgi:hypothetical protein